MQVYQTDAKGFFVGVTQADPDPKKPGQFLIPGGCVETLPPELGKGQRAQWNGTDWDVIDPPPPEPEPEPPTEEELLAAERAGMVCSRFQAKAALHAAGLLDQVEAALEQADPLAQLAWADAVEFRRNSPTIAALAGAIGLTDEQIDDLFRSAMEIDA